MTPALPTARPATLKAIEESLAAVFGWFEAEPLPEVLASVVDQLEESYRRARPEPSQA